jgi:hypothetical protein
MNSATGLILFLVVYALTGAVFAFNLLAVSHRMAAHYRGYLTHSWADYGIK